MNVAGASLALLLAAWLLLLAQLSADAADTLGGVHAAGMLRCGVIDDLDDYSEADTHGDLSALGAEYCRALAAEIFADPKRVRIATLPDEPAALAALHDRSLDVVFGVTPNPVTGAIRALRFGPPILIDGQGFLVSKRSGIRSLADLGNKRLCFINAAPPEQVLYDVLEPRLKTREMRLPYSERGEMNIALLDGHCDAISADLSLLANVRASFQARATQFDILPDTLTVDPVSPAMRDDDPRWASLVDWTVWSLLAAEAHGINRDTVTALATSHDTVVRRLLGLDPWIGRALGVPDTAFAQAIRAVGNAGEIYTRDVGTGSPLDLPRGRSAPVDRGGLLWTLPIEPLQ